MAVFRRRRPPAPAPPASPPPPAGVLGRATLAGERAASARQFDEFSFGEPAKIPYLERLDKERHKAIFDNAGRAWSGAREILGQVRRHRRQEHTEQWLAAAALEQARRWRDRAREREDITLEGLDIMSGEFAPPERPGWDLEDPLDIEPETAPGDTLDGGPEGEEPTAAGPAESSDGRRRLRWMGPADGRRAVMPMPPRLKLAILLGLTLVEVPIYYEIFRHLHGADDWLTIAFTVPIAFGMVLAPHLAGQLFRNRHAMPVERVVPYLVTAMMVLWAVGAIGLGYLRQKVLLLPQVDPLTNVSVGGAAQLGVSPFTMTCVFTVVLLVSGLIAFTLGIGDEHPGLVAYRAAVQVRRESEAAYLAAVRARAQTLDTTLVPEAEQLATHWREAQEQELALWAEYQAASATYLDTIALGIGEPTLTQAVSSAVRSAEPPTELRTAQEVHSEHS